MSELTIDSILDVIESELIRQKIGQHPAASYTLAIRDDLLYTWLRRQGQYDGSFASFLELVKTSKRNFFPEIIGIYADETSLTDEYFIVTPRMYGKERLMCPDSAYSISDDSLREFSLVWFKPENSILWLTWRGDIDRPGLYQKARKERVKSIQLKDEKK